MTDRNEKREVLINKSPLYKKRAKEKNLNFFRQYSYLKLNRLTTDDIQDLTIMDHIWKAGDRYYKLAHKYYGSTDLWWILAWFNKRPTEHHVKLGDAVRIPLPLEKVLYLYYK